MMGIPADGQRADLRVDERDPRRRRPRVRRHATSADGRRARDVRLRPGARRGPPRQPDRRHHVGDDGRRGRRRAAHAAGVRLVLHPARRRRQRDDPQRDQPRDEGAHRLPRPARAAGSATSTAHATTAVEEIVRWATPVIHFRRTATADTSSAGSRSQAGDKVVLFYNSANRDERVFADPYRSTSPARCSPPRSASAPAARTSASAPTSPAARSPSMFDEIRRRLPDAAHHRRARLPAERLHQRHQAPARALVSVQRVGR